MRNGLRNIIHYFSKSNLKTIALLFMALITSLYFNAILNPLSPTISQRIAEESTPSLDTEEQNFLNTLNEHRAELGLSELELSKKLTQAAEWMAQDLSETKSQSHTDSLGRNSQKRLKDFGYDAQGGENIAFAGGTGEQAFTAWLNSPQHKLNMENPLWKVVGIGRVQGNENWYWVSDFGNTIEDGDIILSNPEPTSGNTTPAPTSPLENEDQNCSATSGRNNGCICETNSQCKANICTEWKSVSTGKYCGEEPEEDDESEMTCEPNDRTDSGEFDNSCDEILHCKDATGRKGLCLCETNAQCASGVCLPRDEDYDDNRFCKKEDITNPNPTAGAPIDATLTFKVALPGIGTNTKLGLNNTPKRINRTFYVQFLNENNEIVQEEQVPLTYSSGVYTGELSAIVPQGSYEIKIASDNSLFKAIPGVIAISSTKTSFNLPTVTLITGNISQANGSLNNLDIFDYNALLSCFGNNSCKNLSLTDLNDDGIIDSRDFNILLRGFAVQ